MVDLKMPVVVRFSSVFRRGGLHKMVRERWRHCCSCDGDTNCCVVVLMVADEDAQVVCAAAVKMEAARMEDRGVEARRNCGEDGPDGGASRWLLVLQRRLCGRLRWCVVVAGLRWCGGMKRCGGGCGGWKERRKIRVRVSCVRWRR
ncbi:hypothetical protein DEO72_LG6g1192 [Vigna unguiculata]|uniref:Uncharacterized protein n=1 Tax=Vigna unguiculata TaxID=3917 RepID=A0A4D6M7F0_VIGUN|nr:hypothetical protein DEO72_LG6g1192 [Vigna unguiculata]